MSNLPPNPYNSLPGAPPTNANTGQVFKHNLHYNQLPPSQLPPGYDLKDANSNSPLHMQQNSANNLNQSASSSPAFNLPGSGISQPSPVRHMVPKPVNVSHSVSPAISNPSSNPYTPNYQSQHQLNDNPPPFVSSSQIQPFVNGPPISHSRPLVNPSGHPSNLPGPPTGLSGPPTNFPGPSSTLPGPPSNLAGPPTSFPGPPSSIPNPLSNISGPPVSLNGPPMNPLNSSPNPVSSSYQPMGTRPPVNVPGIGQPPSNYAPPPTRIPGTQPPVSMMNQTAVPFSGSPSGPVRNSPLPSGPPVVMPPPMNQAGQHMASMKHLGMNGPDLGSQNQTMAGHPMGPKVAGPASTVPGMGQIRPPSGTMSLPSGQMPLPGGKFGPTASAPSGPQMTPTGPLTQSYGQQKFPLTSQPLSPPGLGASSVGLRGSLPQSVPPNMGLQSGPVQAGQPSNMQNRYPQMPPYSNIPQGSNQYPQQYAQGLAQQMGQLSVTKQGFDQLWGHHMIDLLQCKNILPEYPEDPPEIKLGHQFAESANCSPEIFRCTINRIPETNSLLQKSRLPLGILIHPFKDLNQLPVIQCTSIVRCRACRTYINPFVYFVDSKRWKCNLCYRVNDLPDEFQYDPVSKSYGDPTRRPEIKSATIEFIAPGEYMLRPPQPAVYLFLFDVSQIARESGYLQVVCDTLRNNLDQLPGDARTQIGFICFDSHVHYYLMCEGLSRPKEMTVLDIEDVFLPSPESLLVNLGETREMVKELLMVLPQRYSNPGVPGSALGAALQAAYKLMAPTGGRITVFQTCLPNVGPGALQPREDPNARSSKEVAHLNPATDFYKRLALDCSGAQVAVDLFLLNSQYSDLATLSGISKFSAGTVYHIPLFRANRTWQSEQLNRMFTRYLTRKIGFEAVMRVRCTRGVSIHTFHGNFFVRSTDLLSLPNVSPDAGFGMQLVIEESLSDLQQVCFQAALLYTSSKGERRIRVHTLTLPIASNLTDVLHAADQQCIIGLLSKMAVDRCVTASLSEAREAVMNVAVDALSAHRLAQNLPAGTVSAALHAPASLKLLPLYLLALLKRKAFRTGTSTRLDDRVADMCALKCLPLGLLLRGVYPDLYPIHTLRQYAPTSEEEEEPVPDPPRLQLSAERISLTGAYLLDDGETMIIYIGSNVSPAFLSEMFGVAAFSQLPDEARSVPKIESEGNALLHAFIDKLNDDRPYPSNIIILRDNSTSKQLFTERLIEDRVESAFSYYEFLTHVKNQVK